MDRYFRPVATTKTKVGCGCEVRGRVGGAASCVCAVCGGKECTVNVWHFANPADGGGLYITPLFSFKAHSVLSPGSYSIQFASTSMATRMMLSDTNGMFSVAIDKVASDTNHNERPLDYGTGAFLSVPCRLENCGHCGL